MLVEMKNIVMDFGPVRAVDHVDLTVRGGEILLDGDPIFSY